MLKAIVFDFDGVIADSEPLHYEAFRAIATTFGVRFDYQQYVEKYIGYDDRDALAVMLNEAKAQGTLPAKTPDIAELCDRKATVFEAIVERGVRSYAGVPELVAAAAKSMPVAIASGATRQDIELILGKLALTKHFKIIVSADDVAKSKPHPETYAKAASALGGLHPQLNLQPSECLAIEDTSAGLKSARAAGLMTLAVTTTSPRADLHHAHRVIDALEGVTIDQLRAWYD